MNKAFNKNDLQSGMIVKFRKDSELGFVIRSADSCKILCNDGYIYISDYDNNLRFLGSKTNSSFDIVKIYSPIVSQCYNIKDLFNISKLKCIWSRFNKVKIKRSDIREAFNIDIDDDFEIID